MANSKRSVQFTCATTTPLQPANVSFTNACTATVFPHKSLPEIALRTDLTTRPENGSFASSRCTEKACVFPAISFRSGKCSYHEREAEEPALFSSQQPSRLLLDPARLPALDAEVDEDRRRDRRRLARQWEDFLKDAT